MARKLSDQQQAFVDAYLTCFNWRDAARMADYSINSVKYLKQHPGIRAAIREELDNRGLTRDEVLDTLARWFRSDMREAVKVDVDENGKPVAAVDLHAAYASGLIRDATALKQKKGGLVEISMPDKVRVAALVMKAHGIGEGEADAAETEWWKAMDDE